MIKSISIAILLLFPLLSSSQEIEIGGEVGLNMSQLEYHGRTSETLGKPAIFFTSDFLLSDNFSLLGKIGYLSKGGKNLNKSNPNFKGSFHYLSVYLSPRFYFLNRESFHPYFHISPSFSYLLGATSNGLDIKGDSGKTDFALQGGLGIKFDLNDNLIMDLNAGFEQGFSKVLSISPNQFHNRSVPYIGIGIRYSNK